MIRWLLFLVVVLFAGERCSCWFLCFCRGEVFLFSFFTGERCSSCSCFLQGRGVLVRLFCRGEVFLLFLFFAG